MVPKCARVPDTLAQIPNRVEQDADWIAGTRRIGVPEHSYRVMVLGSNNVVPHTSRKGDAFRRIAYITILFRHFGESLVLFLNPDAGSRSFYPWDILSPKNEYRILALFPKVVPPGRG